MKCIIVLLTICTSFGLCGCSEDQQTTTKVAQQKSPTAEDRKLILRLEQARTTIELTEDTTLLQGLNFLAIQFGAVDPPSSLPALFRRWYETLPAELQSKKIGKVKLDNVSPAEVLDVLFMRCGYNWEVVNGELVLEERKNEGNAEVWQKLHEIKLENVAFTEETTFRQAINFLRLRARELDGPKEPVASRGVGFLYRDRNVKPDTLDKENELKNESEPSDEKAAANEIVGDLSIRNVSLAEALTVVSRRAGLRWHIGKYRVIFTRR